MTENSSKSASKNFTGKGIFPPKYAFTLLLPFRNLVLSPKKLIRRLKLQKNSVVLEVGPGPGYFSVHVARAIPEGKLVLADIQPEMLAYAKRRLSKKNLTNVAFHLCNGRNFPFEDGTFDVIFLVTVLGEIENKKEYIREFYRILKPNGLLSISELSGDPDKMSINEINELLKDSGFELQKVFGSRRNFTVNFRKKAA
jgi:ubiquinone/menaquinone biosynthesis C-methylase UbiE